MLHDLIMQSTKSKFEGEIDLDLIQVRPLLADEHERFNGLLSKYHYLGCPAFVGKTIKYIALHKGRWIALLSFSSAALQIQARDTWIGWQSCFRLDRLHLIANNTRFLILPECSKKNLASKVISRCLKRLSYDWQKKFHHPLLLVETFVDPSRFIGTVYLASGWVETGMTKGFRKSARRYVQHGQPKKVFLKTLHPKGRKILQHPVLCEPYRTGVSQMAFNDKQIKSLFDCIDHITDPRSPQGLRHHKAPLVAICVAATLCGAEGFAAIFDWAEVSTKTMKRRLKIKYEKGSYVLPSLSTIRRFLIAVDPNELNAVLSAWIHKLVSFNSPIAIDGKTMRGTSKKKVHKPMCLEPLIRTQVST